MGFASEQVQNACNNVQWIFGAFYSVESTPTIGYIHKILCALKKSKNLFKIFLFFVSRKRFFQNRSRIYWARARCVETVPFSDLENCEEQRGSVKSWQWSWNWRVPWAAIHTQAINSAKFKIFLLPLLLPLLCVIWYMLTANRSLYFLHLN